MSRSEDSDADDQTVRARYEWSSTPPSTAVVETVSAVVGDDPTEGQRLYECVDPDALDALIESSHPTTEGEVTVSFVFKRRRVTVYKSGHIIVEPVSER